MIAQHGLPDADRDYSLDAKKERPPALRRCEACLANYEGSACPACGTAPEPRITGERTGPEQLDDAEQVHFTSGDEELVANIPPHEREIRQVDIDWIKPRTIKGVFESRFEKQTQWGPRQIYVVLGDRYRWAAPGTTVLDKLMVRVKPGERVVIAYTGDQPLPGGKFRKLFRVAVDDGAPE